MGKEKFRIMCIKETKQKKERVKNENERLSKAIQKMKK